MDLFADEIGAIHVTGNLVRLDFTAAQPGEEGGATKTTGRLVMPLEGFIKAFNLQEQLVRQLTQSDVLVDGRVFANAAAPKNG